MTEYNTFCWAENYNDDNSFQQKRYRIFNHQYEKSAYNIITVNIKKILKDTKLKDISQEQIKLIKAIPDLVFDEYGFTYITEVIVTKELTDVEKAIELLTSKGMIRDGKVIHLS